MESVDDGEPGLVSEVAAPCVEVVVVLENEAKLRVVLVDELVCAAVVDVGATVPVDDVVPAGLVVEAADVVELVDVGPEVAVEVDELEVAALEVELDVEDGALVCVDELEAMVPLEEFVDVASTVAEDVVLVILEAEEVGADDVVLFTNDVDVLVEAEFTVEEAATVVEELMLLVVEFDTGAVVAVELGATEEVLAVVVELVVLAKLELEEVTVLDDTTTDELVTEV